MAAVDSRRRHLLSLWPLAGCPGLLAAGCATTADQQSMGEYLDDAAVTLRVRSRLVNDRALAAAVIEVDVLAGVVQLKGDVRSASERLHAEALARATQGVKGVRNQIAVKP